MRLKFVIILIFLSHIAGAQGNAVKDSLTVKDTTALIDSSHAEHPDTAGWHVSGLFDVKFTQVSLHNWAGGGQSSIAFNTEVSLSADYHHSHINWTNSLAMDYGFFNQAKSPYWAKTDDRLELNSLFGREAFKHWEYESFLTFRTQFSAGYSNPLAPDSMKTTISGFMAPGYINSGIGLDYKPGDHFNIVIAPISAKITIVNNQLLADMGAFGVPFIVDSSGVGIGIPGSGKKSRKEFGGTFKLLYKSQLTEKFDIHIQLDLFSNYKKNPQNIDVNFEGIFNWKINKYMSVSIHTVLIYDDDINITRNTKEIDETTGLFITKTGPITQFSEIFGLGFNYSFNK